MRDLFITWIIFQLLVIGFIGSSIRNDCIDGEKQIITHQKTYAGILFPLVFFIPNSMTCDSILEPK